jgi:hypothetical protein
VPVQFMKIVLIGLDHATQWKDPTGDLKQLLGILISGYRPKLIAEEAYKLPTTVAQRLAFQMEVPWLEIDMNDSERLREGIHQELAKRPSGPALPDGYSEGYLANADP